MLDRKERWKLEPRADGRMEWRCEHGVGHGMGVHGCHFDETGQTCCASSDFPGKHVKIGDILTDEYGNKYQIIRKSNMNDWIWRGVKK